MSILDLYKETRNEVFTKESQDKVTDDKGEIQASNTAGVSSADSLTAKSDPADDLPIFTATLKELEFWHACLNCHIQNFLRDYDLSSGSKAYDSFKIGVDEQVHALTFALDDTHYLKIDLTDNNFRPIDMEQAEKVLRKVNDLRFAQNKKLSRRYEVIREIPI